MPHCILELSSNVKEVKELNSYLVGLNTLLDGFETIFLKSIISRAVISDSWAIGDSFATEQCYIHLTIRLFEGREEELKSEIGKAVLDHSNMFFAKSIESMECSLTIEIQDIEKNMYFSIS